MDEERFRTYMAQLKDHRLTVVAYAKAAVIFRMGLADSRAMSVVLIFLREPEERILITGDLQPLTQGGNGVVSVDECGLGFFARRQGHEYLAEKFLRTDYQPELGKAYWAMTIVDFRVKSIGEKAEMGERLCARLGELCSRFEDKPSTALNMDKLASATETYDEFQSLAEEVYGESLTEGEGLGYDPKALAWLSAIQTRFCELLAERPHRIDDDDYQ